MKRFGFILVLLGCISAFAAEVIPPAPTKYFNDYAGVVSPGTTEQLNRRLEQFEKDSSDQIVVAVFPKMQSDSSVEDYTVRVARAWKVGQKDRNNGAVLFVFVQEHSMFIQTGYGLEGALPDVICKRIIENEIVPRFRNGDIDGGLSAGVNALMAAAKGEYKGTGRTVAGQNRHNTGRFSPFIVFAIVLLFLIFGSSGRRRHGWAIGSGGWTGGGWGGGDGGGFSGGGGGGFSGGGGSFGGGGAGGRW